ncbi:hypothetical protein L210DRAFT_3654005 [Boletus edulis BED1]|uniref:Uncharacterized protein n=1 Tax=Boletus edulis BED1 TaxID=1328754 RepID=A0AAD4BEH0_BOLED|nr:hypothetical protein L210DRAFT_3654005 [Boletus edulis BED1]
MHMDAIRIASALWFVLSISICILHLNLVFWSSISVILVILSDAVGWRALYVVWDDWGLGSGLDASASEFVSTRFESRCAVLVAAPFPHRFPYIWIPSAWLPRSGSRPMSPFASCTSTWSPGPAILDLCGTHST